MTVPATDFILDGGSLKSCTTKHFDEDFEYSLFFCEDCGSPVYARPLWLPDKCVIQVGLLDDMELLEKTPKVELNVKHRFQWLQPVHGAEQREKYV